MTRAWVALLAGGITAAGVLASLLLAPSSRGDFDDLAIAAVVLVYAVVGIVLHLARPANRVGLVMLAGAAAWGAGEGLLAWGIEGVAGSPSSAAYALLAVLGTAARGAGWLLLVLLLPVVFPDGRVESRTAARVAVASLISFTLGALLSPVPLESRLARTDNPVGLPRDWAVLSDLLAVGGLLLAALGIVLAVASLRRRWRHGDELRRQQLLVFGAAFALPLLLLPLMPTPWVDPWMFAVVALPLPVAVAVAVLQRRLYDIPLAVNRTLTYLLLSAVLAAIYVLVVFGVGVMLSDRGAPWLSLAAAAVVAVAFAPLRESLQGTVNRLTYGRWSSPVEVLGETGRRLADAADGPALLRELTDELVTGLGLRRAEVRDRAGHLLSSSGMVGAVTEHLPLTAYGEPVGELAWSGRSLRPSEQELMQALGHQIGGAVHTIALFEDLRRTQEQLVLAREHERRRLRNDLHDGLGPSLAGLGLRVDTVETLIACGRPADQHIASLRAGIGETVAEVRRIVEGLRPPAVDELGLFGAVAELGRELVVPAGLRLELDVPASADGLPAAVEVAAYRVVQEAITNVVRHAHAHTCRIAGHVSDHTLVIAISDDGRGGATPSTGLGLRSMRERAGEIGGEISVTSTDRGTTVTATLPAAVST
ncbi:MAG TPA: sensor histidine kinase [Marmoricola sp.]|nr:sensor histidine kinase [Marmoricola sp.]